MILHLLKKEFLLSDIQMKKLTDFNREVGEIRKGQIEKTQKELQKSVENIDRKISFLLYGVSKREHFTDSISGNQKETGRKKGTKSRLLRELSLKYASVDRLVDKQNQALCTVLKCQGGAVLNAELVQNLIGKVYVYPGKRIEVLWKWKDIWME